MASTARHHLRLRHAGVLPRRPSHPRPNGRLPGPRPHLPDTTTDYFTDDTNSIFQNEINALAESGITTGCTPTTYCPADNVTRGQMAAFLARAFNLPDTTNDYFTDDTNSIFQGDINQLAESAITSGCTPTTYCPADNVTRGQMAAFLKRALD